MPLDNGHERQDRQDLGGVGNFPEIEERACNSSRRRIKTRVASANMQKVLALVAVILMSACNAAVGVSGGVQVPRDAATTCAEHCSSLGLQLSAVAIMANNVGCVCQPRNATQVASASDYSAGTSAGMATIAMQQAEEEQRNARNQRQTTR